jgi:dienelactone hydrolase
MMLVQRGYEVEIVHYLDRSGMVAADGDDRRAHFREWAGTVRDALSDLARSPGVDSSRLAVVGTGLGGTLALTAAATDPRVKAVAEYGGAIPARAASLVQRMPPVLIMHGDKDRAVPLMEAYRIRAMCQAVQAPTELEVFYGQSHVIQGADADALRDKSVVFLDRYLGAR